MSEDARSPISLTHARAAGVLYLLVILCGVGGEAFARGRLTVPGDAGRTAMNLLAHELSFRLSIMADVFMALSDVGLAVLLFLVFAHVSRTLSLMAMAFRLVQAGILGANLSNLREAVTLAHGGAVDVMDAKTMMRALEAHAAGYDLGLFFFGINCLLVGGLLVRARFLHRSVGTMLTAAGLVYLTGSTLRVVRPGWVEAFAPFYVIPFVGELALAIALLVSRGVSHAASTSHTGPRAHGAGGLGRWSRASLGGGPNRFRLWKKHSTR